MLSKKLYDAILILLPLCRCISRTDQHFFIDQYKSFHSNETIILELIESALGCANLCTSQSNCCAASFNKVTESCQLVSSCAPVTLPSESTWIIRKTVVIVQSAITDCSDLPMKSSGQYEMLTFNSNVIQVYCAEGGWLVIQRRIDGSTDFYRNWTDYKKGFGDITADFYIGNDKLHTILSRKNYTLRIDLEDWTNEIRYAEYKTFHVGNEATNYTLSIGDYNGTAGDSMKGERSRKELDGMQFSTYDRDNDQYGGICTARVRSGWWHNSCTDANLNGQYYQGVNHTNPSDPIYWWTWHPDFTPLKAVTMKIKPR
ncbi:Fibrinogen-like protein 1,Tenascin-X,Fibrinogen alpha chain,Angiopoietin-related protein 7,Ficolin-1-B,Ficolin-2,Tenascin-R,Ficolin-1,Fibroleukin,Fibrinogen gamma chain [Mytilus coruscus]|uniref:Fibrinogen-like protein 1,Tenascin-X,Fibrinogen alpha chain,Angiopoietin-related protein 7,Ficolin-1-B,Ficolin-2,Tenascin-R,Ficolin-1,Fibroleukin,Fi brinogen gamma chain n=1 Tax=Mytilus coruscus TaxID=42192 RepID=A0A6J8BAF0_MYTCO|nr:Fibrinogen-like protein 1,Tenascin-X,Fibrinogen alpha chain,Angiopoietin-related protein 7,Ficolin-1-B,Ficolin-2,Tenascin-R,Ficolin-1,Fibroleukin,Fibrinogen gamma chain [Mytilus coruscus]